jgi:hypothetical protein
LNAKIVALLLVSGAVAGCTLHRAEVREDPAVAQAPLNENGQLIQPKMCAFQVATLVRPLRDEAINEAVWGVVDEQLIAPQVRRAWEANGLRIGLISGALPASVESLLKAAPPHQVEPVHFLKPVNEPSLVSMTAATPQLSLILNRDNQAVGKDYKDASGFLRLTVDHHGTRAVALSIVPEIHHGPIQRGYSANMNAGLLMPQNFVIKDGQQEETLSDLGATLPLEPGQVAVVGCRVETPHSLGSFLFTQPEANSDRSLQKLVLVWANRSTSSDPAAGEASKRPAGFEPVVPPDPNARTAAWWRKEP